MVFRKVHSSTNGILFGMATTTLITLMDLTQHGTFNAAVISIKCLLAFILLMEVTPHAIRSSKQA